MIAYLSDQYQNSVLAIFKYISMCQKLTVLDDCFTINTTSTRHILSFFYKFEACNFINKEAPTQVFSFEFCEIFKNIKGFLLIEVHCTFAYQSDKIQQSICDTIRGWQ